MKNFLRRSFSSFFFFFVFFFSYSPFHYPSNYTYIPTYPSFLFYIKNKHAYCFSKFLNSNEGKLNSSLVYLINFLSSNSYFIHLFFPSPFLSPNYLILKIEIKNEENLSIEKRYRERTQGGREIVDTLFMSRTQQVPLIRFLFTPQPPFPFIPEFK